MKMKPILFNGDMVRALLDNRKTVTRRVMKPQPEFSILADRKGRMPLSYWVDNERWVKPPYQPGDTLYVRETWRPISAWSGSYTGCRIEYKAGGVQIFDEVIALPTQNGEWHPSIHMPREAARIFLRVTDVRVERLQGIDDAGAKAERANWRNGKNVGFEEKMRRSSIDRFAEIWNSTINPADRALYGWEANPWVWVIEFERFELTPELRKEKNENLL